MTSEQRGRLESLAASCGPNSTVGGDVAAALAEVDRLRALADRTPADCDEVLRLRAEVERLTAERSDALDAIGAKTCPTLQARAAAVPTMAEAVALVIDYLDGRKAEVVAERDALNGEAVKLRLQLDACREDLSIRVSEVATLTRELETAKRVERERWGSARATFGPGVGPQ